MDENNNVIVRVPEQQFIKGEDGYSPVVTVEEIEHGHSVNITDKEHPEGQSFDVLDGDSAYEQAVAGGYEKSEAEFNTELASFKTLHDETEEAAPFYALYGVTTKEAIQAAINGKRQIYVNFDMAYSTIIPYVGEIYYHDSSGSGTGYRFSLINGTIQTVVELTSQWSSRAYNLTDPAQRAEEAAQQALNRMNSADQSARAAAATATTFTEQTVPAAVQTVNTAKNEAVGAVNTAKDAAILALGQKSTDEQAAIQQAGEDVLDELQDYADLPEDVADLKSALDNNEMLIEVLEAFETDGDYVTSEAGEGIIRRDTGAYSTATPVWKHTTGSVQAGKYYKISGYATNNTFCLAVFTNDNGDVIGYTENYAPSDGTLYLNVVVQVPLGATKIVVNTNTDKYKVASIKEVELDSVSDIADKELTPIASALSDMGRMSQLAIKWKQGYIDAATGAEVVNSVNITTVDIIHLGWNSVIVNGTSDTLRVYRYYADGTFIGTFATIQAGQSYTINAPIFIKMTAVLNDPSEGSLITVKSNVYQALNVDTDELINIDTLWTNGYITNTDGSVVPSASHMHTDELLRSNGKLEVYNLYNANANLFLYQSDGTYIVGSWKVINAGASLIVDDDVYYKLSLESAQDATDAKNIVIRAIPNEWKSRVYLNTQNNTYWKNKKIVWFGTSIPAGVVNAGGANGNGSYPARLGRMLGATVYNEAVGSSQVRAGSYHNITTDDPMGYGGCSAPSLMYSLSLSSTEKQDIIDNWDSKWSNIITWFGSQYDASKAAEYKNASWDIKLAKYLTGGSVGPCDLYVFDHGYNDGIYQRGFTDLSDVPATADDRTYFLGAMSFLVGKILADNPKAKILFIGHYCTDTTNGRSDNFLTKYVTDAQEKLASIWQYPLIRTWEYIGFNHVPITVDSVQTTVADIWMPDGIHPSSDPTGEALKHYADVLYPLIRDVR